MSPLLLVEHINLLGASHFITKKSVKKTKKKGG
jgi:hypothetical protein